jgi:oligopeptide/dipeptide ABC transporter ATP-binding protein
MTGYLIRRFLQAVVVVWLVTVITFILLKALPGGPVRAILGTRASDPVLVKALTVQLGLNKPVWSQYWSWLDGLLHGNFGFSYVQNQSVASLLGQRLPRTLLLLGVSTLLALLVAVPFGIIQAVRRNRVADYVGTGFSFLFYAMPVYLTGIILINVFVFETHTFPAEGAQGGTWSFFTQFNAMILPIITLTLVTLASFSRYMRSSTLDQLTDRKRRRHGGKVQLMFQDSSAAMDPRMRVGTILREPLVIQHQGSRGDQQRQVLAILDEVGLPAAAADRYPHEFSGGQRQRLGLARALVLRPDMIVGDEPVSALDVSIQAQILNLMRDLQREHELTYLFISHDLQVVRYMADTIGVMYLGKLVECGPAEDVYSRPVHPYTKGLIDTVPVADPAAQRAKEHKGVRGELPSAISPPSGCRFRTRCPRARDLCAEQEPPLRPFTAAGQQAACHFPLREPEAGLTPPAD